MNIRYSKNDCIGELKKISETACKTVTRDYFRLESEIPESDWIFHFGTFKTFKKAAGLDFSSKFLNQIAKHASKDSLRDFSEEKSSWEGNYDKPSSKRFQSFLIGSDIHDINCDPFYRQLFIETASRLQPEKIILNGDIFDMPEFSKFTVDPREYRIIERIQWVHQFLADLREECGSAEINLLEGNHEYRLLRHLGDADPGLKIILSDLHGLKIKDLLALDKFEVNFMARADLAAFTEKDIKDELSKNYFTFNDQVLFHHFPDGQKWGMPGAHGHHHKILAWSHYSPQFGAYNWHQLGCGHSRRATYTNAEKWQNGFILAHLDLYKKRTQFEVVDCTGEHCVIGGKFYERDEEEKNSFI